MQRNLKPINLRQFLNQRIIVRTRDGEDLSGELVNVGRSAHESGVMGNLILKSNNGHTIVRGNQVRFIALEKDVENDKVQYAMIHGKPVIFLPTRLAEPLQIIADREGFTLEEVVNAVLIAGAEEILNNGGDKTEIQRFQICQKLVH
jgi:small nuclear ribonucleoprotein (snRNP)-like protein